MAKELTAPAPPDLRQAVQPFCKEDMLTKKEKYDQYVRFYNRMTRPAARNRMLWTPEDDATLMRIWPSDRKNRIDECIRAAVLLERTLVACRRRLTFLRKREQSVSSMDK